MIMMKPASLDTELICHDVKVFYRIGMADKMSLPIGKEPQLGISERIQTFTPLFRRQMLYSVELQRYLVMVDSGRVELPISDCKTDVIPFN